MLIQYQNYSEPGNIDIDTNIEFLSPLFAMIMGHRQFMSTILKMAATSPTDQYNRHSWIP